MTEIIFEENLIEKVTEYMKEHLPNYTLVLVGENDRHKLALMKQGENTLFGKNCWAVCTVNDDGSCCYGHYTLSEYEAQNWFFYYPQMLNNKPTYERMSEIAEKCVAALVEDDEESAQVFFENELDFNNRERAYFGV